MLATLRVAPPLRAYGVDLRCARRPITIVVGSGERSDGLTKEQAEP